MELVGRQELLELFGALRIRRGDLLLQRVEGSSAALAALELLVRIGSQERNESITDRSSKPHRSCSIDATARDLIIDLRRDGMTTRRIADISS